SGDSVTISTPRGEVTIDAMVTDRMQTLKVDGKDVEVIGVPWGWGFKGLVQGETINTVTNAGYDPNTGTPEYKSCACNVTKGGKKSWLRKMIKLFWWILPLVLEVRLAK